MSNVESLITQNSQVLSAALEDMPGVRLVRPFDSERVSGIVSFRPTNKDLNQVQQALSKQTLSTTVRGDAIRLSPHFYQAGKPLLEMLNIIEGTVKIL